MGLGHCLVAPFWRFPSHHVRVCKGFLVVSLIYINIRCISGPLQLGLPDNRLQISPNFSQNSPKQGKVSVLITAIITHWLNELRRNKPFIYPADLSGESDHFQRDVQLNFQLFLVLSVSTFTLQTAYGFMGFRDILDRKGPWVMKTKWRFPMNIAFPAHFSSSLSRDESVWGKQRIFPADVPPLRSKIKLRLLH